MNKTLILLLYLSQHIAFRKRIVTVTLFLIPFLPTKKRLKISSFSQIITRCKITLKIKVRLFISLTNQRWMKLKMPLSVYRPTFSY